MNRGVGKRRIFRSPEDGRFFLELLAQASVRGWIEVHAYALMINHFHLLLRSLNGELSETMRWIQQIYAAEFNESEDRSGALFGQRFLGKRIHSLKYRKATGLYIHLNPERAGLHEGSDDYWETSEPFHESGHGRPWLARQFMRQVKRGRDELPPELVWDWLSDGRPDTPETDRVLLGSVAQLADWLRDQAGHLASHPTSPVRLSVPTTRSVLRAARREMAESTVRVRGRSAPSVDVLRVGILHTLCGMPLADIAGECRIGRNTAARRFEAHVAALQVDDHYLYRAARVLADCIAREYRTD